MLLTGVFNLGVVGVAPEGRPFVDWWSARARRGLRTDSARKAVDLRWFDLAPCFFDHVILSHPGYAVSCWNLHASEMTIDENRYLVAGTRLKMFYFTGFDPQTPFLLSTHQGDRPRILLSQNTAVARLCGAHHDRLLRAGLTPESTCTYGWGVLNSGLALSTRIRRIYRQSLEAHERGDGAEPPNPFLGREEDFIDWLNEPVPARLRSGVSRYLYSIYMDRCPRPGSIPGSGRQRSSGISVLGEYRGVDAGTHSSPTSSASVVGCPFRRLEPDSGSDDRRRQYRRPFPRRSRHWSGSSPASERPPGDGHSAFDPDL